jgi:xylanolytic transcriptional activator XlnR
MTEAVWENLDSIPAKDLPPRILGPPTTVTGTGFFEYFLPLMAILGDIIEVHHRRQHPRLGHLDDSAAVAVIIELLNSCERSIQRLINTESEAMNDYPVPITPHSAGPSIKDLMNNPMSNTTPTPPAATATIGNPLATPTHGTNMAATTNGTGTTNGGHVTNGGTPPRTKDRSRLQLVTAYSTHILHVLHVLLYGKWDAISMLDDDDDWITTSRFHNCASHAIAASEAVSDILKFDPELTFMPYLFGIYLLHGSFILLLFADRMPQLGPNQSVEQACETIIRAHEVCVVTLSTEFQVSGSFLEYVLPQTRNLTVPQKNFRKVLRSTLYSVQGSSPTEWEEHKARRRALSLYRWTKGAKGLGL